MLIRTIAFVAALMPSLALAQNPPRPQTVGDKVAERVGAQLGALMLENISLKAQIEDLQEMIRRRDAVRPDTSASPPSAKQE